MGYYVNYSLEFYNKEVGLIEDLDFLDGIVQYLKDEIGESFENFEFKVSSIEETKWCNWESDVTKISNDNPGVLIVVKGEGESSGDIWQAEFLNGEKISHWIPTIAYPEPSLHKFFPILESDR